MRKVADIKRNFTIKKKLIFYCYMIITPILICISAVLSYLNYERYVSDRKLTAEKSIQGLSDGIEVMQMNMIEFAYYISINAEIKELLTNDRVEELNKETLLWEHYASMQSAEDMLALRGYIKTIAIYPEKGLKPYLRCMDASSYVSDFEQIKELEVYKKAIEGRGKVLFRKVTKNERSIYESSRSDKIVLCREIYDLSKKEKLAFLVVGANVEMYENLANGSIKDDAEGVVVLSDDGEELIRAGHIDNHAADFLEEEFQQLKNGKSRIQMLRYQGGDVFYTQNLDTGIYIVKFLPDYSRKKVFMEVALNPLILMVGVLCGMWPVLIIVSNIITKPLQKLMVAMEQFKTGDFSQQVSIEVNDEIGEVAKCFNRMVKDMKELIDQNYVMTIKERESELTALQAQINPHFLYNTLDSLYWKAETAGNEEIAENILDLAHLFRMVLGQGKGEISVRNEVELVRCYLSIQKMRFEKRLSYDIDVEQDVLDCTIPKLILQPFVENSIVHGFEGDGAGYRLQIRIYKEDGYLVFIVKDTGIGMTQEQLSNVLRHKDQEGKSMRIGRYAIRNVNERLQLRYQNDFALYIESEYKKGTEVTIKIPLGK